MRQQLPAPFSDLEAGAACTSPPALGPSQRRRLSAKDRKTAKFLEAAAKVLASLRADTFPAQTHTPAAVSSEGSRSLVRRVLRELISSAADTSEGRASRGATKVFVMLPGAPGAPAPPGFLPKRGFQLRLHRALHVAIRLTCGMRPAAAALEGSSHTPVLNGVDQNGTQQEGGGCDEVWFQCAATLKGICTPSASTTAYDSFM
ncbi:hypothetical protein WJX81_001881 [Elliptochloris bilobata]|uniref:Uncharacterized protein n=1 Tax=Elliptochloris bilobata TaxID=381761 RepID=A0AAW1QVV1_9CHLO